MRRLWVAGIVALMPTAGLAQFETPFLNAGKLKLLESDAPITAEQIYPQDPDAKMKQFYECGDLQSFNSYISELYGRQEIHYAAVHGDALRVKQLLLEGTEIDVRDNLQATPLILAAGNGRLDVVKILLEAGTDPSLKDGAGYTAYDRAVVEMWPEIVEVLRPYRKENSAKKPAHPADKK